MLTAILVVVFVVLLIAFLGTTGKKKKTTGVGKSFLPRIFFSSSKFRYDLKRNKGTPFILDKAAGEISDIKRNPFTFGLAENSGAVLGPNLILNGILWSEESPSAVINENVLGVGDAIGGFKVKQILKDSVVLDNGQAILELKLN